MSEVDMPDTCRPEVVERLVRVALEAMGDEENTTAAEVLSAAFTLTLRNIVHIRETSNPEYRQHNLHYMREICYRLLTETADESVKM